MPLWPTREATGTPVRTFQMRPVPSALAVASRAPPGLNAASRTAPRWPFSSCRSAPSRRRQMRAVSFLPVVTRSGAASLNSALVTAPPWSKLVTSLPSEESYTRATWSLPTTTNRRPSALNATAVTGLGKRISASRVASGSQSETVRPPPVTTRVPDGSIATVRTGAPCRNERVILPVTESHRRAEPSCPAVTTYRPAFTNAASSTGAP